MALVYKERASSLFQQGRLEEAVRAYRISFAPPDATVSLKSVLFLQVCALLGIPASAVKASY
jgi:hypothetical protein